ncbi:MAG: hypothetical protein ACI9MB_004080 [Verrucomicrobiales bacterium]|jgi:hypothetical protein
MEGIAFPSKKKDVMDCDNFVTVFAGRLRQFTLSGFHKPLVSGLDIHLNTAN